MSAPGEEPEPELVNLMARNGKGRYITRTMRVTDKLQVFLYHGKRVDGGNTVADYEMKSWDEIYFMLEMKPDILVTLIVRGNEGRKITRTTRRTDKLQDLMDFYYSMVPTVPYACNGVFVYHGKRVDGWNTVAHYEMKSGDQIDFMLEMKPGVLVTLTVDDEEGRKIVCTMRRTDKLQELMDFYHVMVPIAGEGGFMFDGRRLNAWETPVELQMEDGDEIDFIPYVYG